MRNTKITAVRRKSAFATVTPAADSYYLSVCLLTGDPLSLSLSHELLILLLLLLTVVNDDTDQYTC